MYPQLSSNRVQRNLLLMQLAHLVVSFEPTGPTLLLQFLATRHWSWRKGREKTLSALCVCYRSLITDRPNGCQHLIDGSICHASQRFAEIAQEMPAICNLDRAGGTGRRSFDVVITSVTADDLDSTVSF